VGVLDLIKKGNVRALFDIGAHYAVYILNQLFQWLLAVRVGSDTAATASY